MYNLCTAYVEYLLSILHILFIYCNLYILFTQEGRSPHPFFQRNELFYPLKWWHHRHYYHFSYKNPVPPLVPERVEGSGSFPASDQRCLPHLCPCHKAQVCFGWGTLSSFSFHLGCCLQTYFLICFNIWGNKWYSLCRKERNGEWKIRWIQLSFLALVFYRHSIE